MFDAPADSLPSYRVGQNAAPSWGAPAGPAFSAGMGGVTRPDPASYASSRGYSISALCAAAWAAPPFSSVAILVWETENVCVLRSCLRSMAPATWVSAGIF